MLLVASASTSSQLPALDGSSDDRKAPCDEHRNWAPTPQRRTYRFCRGDRCNKVTEWLVGLLGKIAVQSANLLDSVASVEPTCAPSAPSFGFSDLETGNEVSAFPGRSTDLPIAAHNAWLEQ